MIIITLFVLLVVLVIAFALADDIGVQARRRELRKRISEIDTQLDYIDSEIESRAKEIEACKREHLSILSVCLTTEYRRFRSGWALGNS